MQKRQIHRLEIPEVKSIFESKEDYVVKLDPHNLAMVVSLLFTLVVLVGMLIAQINGVFISLRVVLVYSALVFVLGYGITGILVYYGIMRLRRKSEEFEKGSGNETQDKIPQRAN